MFQIWADAAGVGAAGKPVRPLHFFSCVARVVLRTLGVVLSFQPHVVPRLCAQALRERPRKNFR
eukprot:SAG11_NODE_24578_length_371_cov_0.926471_1_plen_63_part_10